jgi:hypothetical protein
MHAMKTSSALALAMAAACLARTAAAGAPLPADAQHVLGQRFPGWSVESRVEGPLRAPGAHDLALVLVRVNDAQTHAVAVLLDDGHGGLRFGKSSSAIDVGTRGEALAVDVRERALVVRATEPGASVAVVTSYRFAFRDDGRALRLVGLDVERVAAGDAAQAWRGTTSVDLLTGAKHETMDDRVRGRPRHREADGRVPVRQPILFEQFVFDTRALRAETTARFEPEATRR